MNELFALAMHAAAAAFSGASLPDEALSDMRGGIALPGGLDVAIAVQTDTKVDGALLLRTVYRVDQGAPQLQVFAPDQTRDERSATPTAPVAPATTGSSALRVTIGASPGGAIGTDPDNATALHIQRDGGAIEAAGGLVSVASTANGQQVQFAGRSIDVSHLVGNAVGSVVVNSGSDRAIDTATTLSIDISGATANNLGSALLRVESLALDSTAAMLPR